MYLFDFKQKEESLTHYPFLSAIFIKNLLFSIGSFFADDSAVYKTGNGVIVF